MLMTATPRLEQFEVRRDSLSAPMPQEVLAHAERHGDVEGANQPAAGTDPPRRYTRRARAGRSAGATSSAVDRSESVSRAPPRHTSARSCLPSTDLDHLKPLERA